MGKELQVSTMDEFIQLGEIMIAGGLAQEKDAKAAAAKLIVGQSLGLNAYESLRHLVLIKGKPEVSAECMAGRIKSSGKYNYRVRKHDSQICIIEFFEGGESVGVSEFSLDDAKQAGLTGNSTYKSYPRNMLFARALQNGRRWYCPDVLNGAYGEKELQEEPSLKHAEPVIEPSPAIASGPIAEPEPGAWDVDNQHQLELLQVEINEMTTEEKQKLWAMAKDMGCTGGPEYWPPSAISDLLAYVQAEGVEA